MADPQNLSPADENQAPPAYTGPERRSGLERRQCQNPEPPPGQEERRHFIRRKADRISLEGTIRIGEPGPGGRLYRRVRIEVPIICRLLPSNFLPKISPLRGLTHTLAPGGVGMLLDEEFRVGTPMEVLVRFGGDLLPADVQVVSVIPQGARFLHNCRFTRLGTADRNWLIEYLRIRDASAA
ncbi:MAG TPA: PilZ domain-containing protein [archaeon]|nr:PilZ domain-containing protein [archaeon]